MESKKSGKKIRDLLPGEEIVISGISGRYPDTDDVKQFRDNLFNKVDMISDDPRRWNHIYPDIPTRAGRLNNVTEFDAGNFGFGQKQTKSTDPMVSLILEVVYEAILDAGYHPSFFEGTNTGVFVGTCMSETEQVNFFKRLIPQGCNILGNNRSMLAQHVSYWLRLKGPTTVTDTACSSSMFAFDQAYRALLENRCDYAIVASSNLCLHPYISLQFALLGVLSHDGACKTFDENANGYARSEGVVAFILQRAKGTNRIYAEVVHSKTNCDGYKEQGITYPSGQVQMTLLEDFYEECGRSPTCHTYMEAHGTGTPVGDPEELTAIDTVCAIGRNRPLYIGSVKSNIGHNEPVSGLCSLTKVIIGFENDAIPPNMNFKEIRKGVEGLEKKRMIVVAEKMPWPDNEGLVGVNCFGFGGANSHVLVTWNKKLKVNNGLPQDNLPRLICFSGRCEKTMDIIIDDLESRPLDAELVALYHNVFMKNFELQYHRGFIVLSKLGTVAKSKILREETKNVAIHFANASANLARTLNDLIEFETFRSVFDRFQNVYRSQNIKFDPTELLQDFNGKNIIHVVIGTVLVQIGLYETLKSINLTMKHVYGSFIGTLTKSYASNLLNVDEVAKLAYIIALLLKESDKGVDYLENKLSRDDIISLSKMFYGPFLQLLNNGNEAGRKGDDAAKQLIEQLLSAVKKDFVVPDGCILIECGKSQLEKIESIRILNDDCHNIIEDFLTNLGRIHLYGNYMRLANLYPKVSFPVSRGTPMIGPVVKLKHTKEWPLVATVFQTLGLRATRTTVINARAREWRFITGHVIDGRNLIPATAYLFVVWNVFAQGITKPIQKLNITFENVKFLRAINVPKSGDIIMDVLIFQTSGYFELCENGSVIVTGNISQQFEPKQFERLPDVDEDNSQELNEKDIYKELRLRGYNYSGMFRSLKKCNINASKGMVQWQNNWVAFLDNMLQIILLQSDSRGLFVPTGIDQLIINGPKHLEHVQRLGEENPLVPVTVWKEAHIIRTEGIELRGMNASAINRRKMRAEPVLEYYKFLPNHVNLTLEESVRANIQMMLENTNSVKIKSVELIDVDAKDDYVPISPMVFQVLGDVPLLQPEVLIYTKKTDMEISNATIEDKELSEEVAAYLISGSNLLSAPAKLKEIFVAVRENGYVISREPLDYQPKSSDGHVVFSVHRTETETLVLLRKKSNESKGFRTVDLSRNSRTFDWIAHLQDLIKANDDCLILYAQNDDLNGILGLVNCLRREQSGNRFRCVFVRDKSAPPFDPTVEFYKKQLDLGMGINVYEDGKWGTYRHLLLDETNYVENDWCFVNSKVLGDLNSLKWMYLERPQRDDGNSIVNIHYSALNFRDIMIASGRLSLDVVCQDRLKHNCFLGFEFSGVDQNGQRVMGICDTGALATNVSTDPSLLFPVPDDWSLEDAATVPLVYSTVLFALVESAHIRNGESILIHSGTGGVGQAAINIAKYFKCNIFTTCGTEEKREFLKKHHPEIPESHIGNSRDISFVEMVMRETNGRGVDMVLNSLAEEKLVESVKCLAPHGRFLEIGKFDISINNPLSLGLLKEGQTFHGVMLDLVFNMEPYCKYNIKYALNEAIKKGVVKPIVRTIFEKDDVVSAFRLMASGKHIGKVLIKVKDTEKPITMQKCVPMVYCNPEMTTVIVGGLGGFGLELADWLILRGCRQIVLNTRNGVVNGYQALRIRIWQGYNVNVVIAKDDVTTRAGCESLLKTAQALGQVEYIFNVAAVLRDKLFENQTVEDYQISLAGKAYATEHLDEFSRRYCPQLKNFVVFSSVSCGRGNAGQTNYGMANSIMERICEQRKRDGLPALVIQWGAVGDVGLVAEMFENAQEMAIAGTLQQRIANCLSLLDNFMFQNRTIVASMVVAEKRIGSGEMGIIETVASILGIRDIKTVSPHITLPELGMDSMMGVEVKQTLEREYDIFLSPQDMRIMTFHKLQEMIQEKEQGQKKVVDESEAALVFFSFVEEEEIAKLPIIKINEEQPHDDELMTVYLIPGIEGMLASMKTLASRLNANAYCLQYGYGLNDDCIEEIAATVFKTITAHHTDKTKPFTMIAHSFGTMVALEVWAQMSRWGYKNCQLILIDGSPTMMKQMALTQLVSTDDIHIQLTVLGGLMSRLIALPDVLKHKEELEKCKSYEERVWYLLDRSPMNVSHSKEYQAKLCISLYKRIKALLIYNFKHEKIDCRITLYKPSVNTLSDAAEDFGLSDLSTEPVTVKYCNGDHVTVLQSEQLADEINRDIANGIGDIGIANDDDSMATSRKEFANFSVESGNTNAEAVKI